MQGLSFDVKKYLVNDIHLNVARIGKGPKIIFVHGWTNNWQGWTLLAHELAPYYELHLLDLPGFGDSEGILECTIPNVARYILGYIEQYAVRPRAIVGASLGSLISTELVTMRPDATENLILLGAMFKKLSLPLIPDFYKKVLGLSSRSSRAQKVLEIIVRTPQSAYLMDKYLQTYKFNKELIDLYNIPGRKKVIGKSYVQIGLSAAQFNLFEHLHRLEKNILLCYGEADKYVNPNHARKIVNELANQLIKLEFIPECGHNVAIEQPEKAAAAIRKFIKTSNTSL